MKLIVKILKSKGMWLTVGSGALLALIFLGGAKFRVPGKWRLLALVAALVVALIVLLVKQIKANRRAALLEQSIRAQGDSPMLSMRTTRKEEIEELKKELLASIEALKKSKLGQKGGGRAALYALPWYLFVGPPAAGKTTAIENSGLEFSFGKDIKGVGGTRNCDWYFSNSAILLDTAGRYMTEDEDKEEWWAFLDTLKKYRKRKPINGVVVGISIADIMTAGVEDIEAHAKNIRRRIDELIQRLGLRFPVYIVFTKCDLIRGFVEFFENLSRREREQIWGVTLPAASRAAARPGAAFEEEFQTLVRALDDVRLKRLESGTKPEIRSRVFTFPLQFAAMKENVGLFIERLFQQNMYREAPIFRGLYFTSGTQEGVPLDLVIQAIAKQFGITTEAEAEPEIQKKSYFIKKLFTDVIIPDQHLGTRTSRASSQRSLARTGLLVGVGLALGLLALGVSQAYFRGRAQLHSLREAAVPLQDVRWARGTPAAGNFRNLERFRDETARTEDFRSFVPSLLPGFSWRARVLPPARELYFRKFRPFFEAYFYRPLEERLQDFHTGAASLPDAAYEDLRTYLLVGKEWARLDAGQKKGVADAIRNTLERSCFRHLTEEEAAEVKPLAERLIEHFVRILPLREAPGFDNDDMLVRSVRRRIIENRETGYAVTYARIKARGFELLSHPFVLSEVVPRSEVLSSDVSVPEFFTQNGWKGYVRDAIEQESERPETGDWILGEAESAAAPEAQDPKIVANALRQAYFLEYMDTWWQFCRSVRYQAPGALEEAAALLRTLSDGEHSPLLPLLKRVDEETRFGADASGESTVSGLVAKIGRATGLSEPKDTEAAAPPPKRVPLKEFDKLHAFFSAEGKEGGSPPLGGILDSYAVVGEALSALAKDSGSKALDVSAQIISGEKGELPDALKVVRRNFPESTFDPESGAALFERPIAIAWAAILGEAQKSMNALWQKKVYDAYRTTLADYYPFSLQGKDSALQDVKRFFAPQTGTFEAFLAEKFKDYLDLESLSVRTWEGQGLTLSDDFLGAVRQGREIGESLFSQGELRMAFSLQPEQYEKISSAVPVIDQVNIVIDGKPGQYRMGGDWAMEFVWPADTAQPGASLAVNLTVNSKQGGFAPLAFPGEWGLFRLLDEAKFEFVNPKEFVVGWLFGTKNVSEVKITYRLIFRSARHPFQPVDRRFFDFACPDRLDGSPERRP